MNKSITVGATINAPIEKVWDFYNLPEHVVNWNTPSPDWHTTNAENDLQTGGKFLFRMEAKVANAKGEIDGFDFGGTYDEVVDTRLIKYTMGDGRKVSITMDEENGQTKVEVSFDLENINSEEKQREGWQAILDNFKKYVESH